MKFGPRLRKLVLTAHVGTSVGWLGAVVAVLALAIAGLATEDATTRRAVHVATNVIAWAALVPLAGASFITGVAQSLGTPWGLLRHYWVTFKLAITVLCTVVLLAYTRTLAELADVAKQRAWSPHESALLESPSVAIHAAAATVLLLAATTLAVVKPAGLTTRGRRHRARRS